MAKPLTLRNFQYHFQNQRPKKYKKTLQSYDKHISQKILLSSVIDKSQVPKAISVIDKLLSPINFSDKFYGKFLVCLTKFFFL